MTRNPKKCTAKSPYNLKKKQTTGAKVPRASFLDRNHNSEINIYRESPIIPLIYQELISAVIQPTTLPETNIARENWWFTCYVSFWECSLLLLQDQVAAQNCRTCVPCVPWSNPLTPVVCQLRRTANP